MPCLAYHNTDLILSQYLVLTQYIVLTSDCDLQAMKSQALTLLASWVVADPSLAVANKLHQQDLPNRILEDLVNRAHQFLPGVHAGNAVQVCVTAFVLFF